MSMVMLIILWYMLTDDDSTYRRMARWRITYTTAQQVASYFGNIALRAETTYNQIAERQRTV